MTGRRENLGDWTGTMFAIREDSFAPDEHGHPATHLLVVGADGKPVEGARIVVWHGRPDGRSRGGAS